MESNKCVCAGDYMEILKNLINSILNSTGYFQNINRPATDSGYTAVNRTTNSLNNPESATGIDFMSIGFYVVMMLVGVLLVLTGRPKKKAANCK
jgi:hypothetical protein